MFTMKKAALLTGLTVILAMALLVVIRSQHSPSDGNRTATAPRVAILTMGSFPLLDSILNELTNTLGSSSSPMVNFTVFNANFQPEILRKSSRDMVSGPYVLLVSLSTPATQMTVAENAGRKPVVFAFVSTPSEIGWTSHGSLTNVTGFVDTVPCTESLAIIEQITGKNATIGYVVNDGEAPAKHTYEQMAKAAERRGMMLKKIPVSAQNEIRPTIAPVLSQVDCLMFGPDSVASGAADLIVDLAAEQKKPVYSTDMISVGRGCLACVAPDYAGLGRRTGNYVLRILQGENTDKLPVTDFDEYKTYLNVDTAQRLGIEIPAAIRDSAVGMNGKEPPKQ